MLTAATAVAALGAGATAAATVTDGVDPLSIIQDFGFPTAVVLLLIFGLLRTKGESERLEKALTDSQADAKQARSEHTALVNQLVNDIVPALTRSADATAASTAAVQEMTRRAISGGG